MEKELSKYKSLTFLLAGIVIGAFIFGFLFLSYNKFGNNKGYTYQYSGNELDITDYEKELNKENNNNKSKIEESKKESEVSSSISAPATTKVNPSTPVPTPVVTPAPKVETPSKQTAVETFNNTTNTDNEVISYVDTISNKLKNNEVTEAGASTYFTTLVDFLFYGGTIKGHTFSELSESAKLKVTAAASTVMDYMDTKFPGLKNSLTNEYYTSKDKIKNFYNTQKNKYCTNNPDICNQVNLDYENFKEVFGGTFSHVGESIVSKLDEWYQIYKAS